MLNKNVKPIWLVSYPKSGNTWVRLFYTALTTGTDVDINKLGTDGVISARNVIDTTLGIYSSHIHLNDILTYRPALYHTWAKGFVNHDFIFCKVHDACALNGTILFPAAITRGVVYVLRNPFDMVASTANHENVSIEKALNFLCDNENSLLGSGIRLGTQVKQHLGTWSNHVESWTNVHRDNILIVKYENLLHDSLNEFSKIVAYMELDYSEKEIEAAILKTSFKDIQQQESKVKFKELPKRDQFFRAGVSGGWRNEITAKQADLIIDCNYGALLKYNYIDAAGNILV
ncbi:sulfotransferase domain-containing protein [soil metagenome]|jgi:aryl sulfotransferase